MKRYVRRHQKPAHWRTVLHGGAGAMLAIGFLGALGAMSGMPLLLAPFGASCVLLFNAPEAPFSQPANVIGGYVVSLASVLVLHALFPGGWEMAAIAVGLAIMIMQALRVTHPPAGAVAVLAYSAGQDAGMLAVAVLAGAASLVVVAALYYRVTGQRYPV